MRLTDSAKLGALLIVNAVDDTLDDCGPSASPQHNGSCAKAASLSWLNEVYGETTGENVGS